jgi:hypothetical protein
MIQRLLLLCMVSSSSLLAAMAMVVPPSSPPFASSRHRAARNLLLRYNTTMSLLSGAHAGGHGMQPNGYSIIDENYLASRVLHPYNRTVAARISASVAEWLAKPGAAGWKQDRRENLWGVRTCAAAAASSIRDGYECTVLGSYTPDPPLAGVNVADSPFVVYSELNNNVTFTIEKCSQATGLNINHCVPLLLALHLGGDDHNASRIFQQLLSTWDGVGFGPPKQPPHHQPPHNKSDTDDTFRVGRCRTRFDELYTTRSFGYFLLAQRAMSGQRGFEVSAPVVAEMEAALWKLQVCDPDGGGLPASYNTAGEPCCAGGNSSSQLIQTSIETVALSLLPYDTRIRTQWFPRALPAS